MYKIDVKTEGDVQPWLIAVEKRIQYALQGDGRNICLIIYDEPDTSTFRYRGYNIFQNMQGGSEWKTVYFFADELQKIEFLLPKIKLVVASRTKWTYALQRFIDKVKEHALPFFFDVDDCVFDLDYIPLIMNTLNVEMTEINYNYWFSYVSRIGKVAEQADGFTCTNAYLKDMLEKKFLKPGYVISNILNTEQIKISEECVRQKTNPDNKFVIGYFSGTPSHINDFKMVYRDIIALMERYSDIYLHIVGFMEYPEDMRHWINKKRVKIIPLVDFMTLQKLVAEVDVNIVPLVNNQFTNCKSELKYFEAAIVDTITCATPVYTYKTAIEDGVNGFLCRQSDWYDTLERIYLKQADIEGIVCNAHKHAVERYYGVQVTQQIEAIYNLILKK